MKFKNLLLFLFANTFFSLPILGQIGKNSIEPCHTNIDTSKLLLNSTKYLREVKKNFCHQAIIDILLQDKEKNKGVNDSIYIERLSHLIYIEGEKRPWEAIIYSEELIAFDKFMKAWEASGRRKTTNAYKFAMRSTMIRANLIELKVKEGQLMEAIPDIKAVAELIYDKNILWCASGDFIAPIYFDFLKLVENEDEAELLSITKKHLFIDFKHPRHHKIVRKMEVETLVYLEKKYGKAHLWQTLENGIQQLSIKEVRYPKGHYQVFVPAFGEEIPVHFEALNKALDAHYKDVEKRKVILALYQKRLRKTFLYWIMRGNARE